MPSRSGRPRSSSTSSGAVLRGRDHRLLTGADGLDLVAVGLQAGPHRAPDLRLVVDDEHAGHARPPARRLLRDAAASRTGSSNTTAVPPPGRPLDPDPPAVREHDRARDREAEAAAAAASGTLAPSCVNGFEHALALLGLDPRTLSATRTCTPSATARPRSRPRRPAVRSAPRSRAGSTAPDRSARGRRGPRGASRKIVRTRTSAERGLAGDAGPTRRSRRAAVGSFAGMQRARADLRELRGCCRPVG